MLDEKLARLSGTDPRPVVPPVPMYIEKIAMNRAYGGKHPTKIKDGCCQRPPILETGKLLTRQGVLKRRVSYGDGSAASAEAVRRRQSHGGHGHAVRERSRGPSHRGSVHPIISVILHVYSFEDIASFQDRSTGRCESVNRQCSAPRINKNDASSGVVLFSGAAGRANA